MDDKIFDNLNNEEQDITGDEEKTVSENLEDKADEILSGIEDMGEEEEETAAGPEAAEEKTEEEPEQTAGSAVTADEKKTEVPEESTYSWTPGSNTPETVPEPVYRTPSAGTYPAYSAPRYNGNGNVTYVPQKTKKKGKGGKVVLTAVLVVIGLLLATACGYGGAYLANRRAAEQAQQNENNDDNAAVLYRSVETTVTGDASAIDVAATCRDSVVEIYTEYVTYGFFQQYVQSGAGSGVIISEDGYIVTNDHVVAKSSGSGYADNIKVTVTKTAEDGTQTSQDYDATVVGGLSGNDIAVLKIDAEGLTPVVFADSDKCVVGQQVVLIGNPLGQLGGTVTSGIVSCTSREIAVDENTLNLMQIDAALNPGNSGGGLFNMNGELIGIADAKSSGTGIEGLGFVIPSNDAQSAIDQILEQAKEDSQSSEQADVKIGITTVNISSEELARYYGLDTLGVYIYSVEEGFNDDVLQSGDRIISINGQEISQGSEVVSIVRSSKEGSTLEFEVERKGQTVKVDVRVYSSSSSGRTSDTDNL